MSWPSGEGAETEAKAGARGGAPVLCRKAGRGDRPTAAEMAEVVASNPFPDRAANATVAIFLDQPRPPTR